jgi:Cysteine/serine-rich nuclear protein N-terminus
MPPPPPPSASYLLVLDSDSEDDEEDDRPVVREEPIAGDDYDERSTPTSGSRRPHVVEDENEDDVEEEDVDTSMDEPPLEVSSSDQSKGGSKKLNKNQKRKVRRKKKKSKRGENGPDTEATTSTDSKGNGIAKVSFSSVSVRTFPRAFSPDAVPADGGWPLGMELDNHHDEEPMDLEEFEAFKQEELRERWETMLEAQKNLPASPSSLPSKSKPSSSPSSNSEKPKPIDPEVILLMDSLHKVNINGKNKKKDDTSAVVYETRQWDYRNKVKNPLFGVLSEAKRQAIFLASSGGSEADQQKQQQHDKSSESSSKGRARSNSVSSVGSAQSSKQHGHNTRRSRTSSNGNSSSIHNFNETYNQVYVMHVRNELEELRNERNKSGATGCNCRKLNVYIPPKDGSGGKKAQHKRLKPSKLTQELKKRDLYDESMSREDMEKVLHKAVEEEPCCRDEDCFCVRNGIDCQADACSCWHDSHVHVKRYSDSGPLTNEEIEKRCGNPLGMYVVDLDAIDSFRSMVISNQKDGMLFCLPTSTTAETGQ